MEDRATIDTGTHHHMSDVVTMRRRNLVRVLDSMGQAADKQRQTQLDVLHSVVALLSDPGRSWL